MAYVIIAIIVALLIGLGIGIIIGGTRFKPHSMGYLRVDRSDPTEPPYLFLELGTDVGTVMNSKYVTFQVKVENFLPHE